MTATGQRWKSGLWITVVAFLTALLLVGVWSLLAWYVYPSTPEERNNAVALLAQMLGGAALLGGLFFTWRAQRFTQRTMDENLRIAQRTLETSEQRQIHERFMRAINQVGDGQLWARVGGIYSLERIARDSDEYYSAIMEVLTAFVRENAARPPSTSRSGVAESNQGREDPIRPDPDIQAALRVIGRRHKYFGHGEDRGLDLSGSRQYVESAVDLRGADLDGAHLEAADLRGVRLEGASLVGARLREAALWEARLDGAFLVDADLERAALEGASLKNARMVGANLRDANLSGADLSGAAVSRRELAKAASLVGATLPNGETLDSQESEEIFKKTRHR